MRLLECSNDGQFSLTNDLTGNNIPLYAILSHRWGPDGAEVTYRDVVDGTGADKAGYEKVKFCAEQAKRDGLRYFWVDTCCIDKSNSNELQESINSMFGWYRNAARCYVYLSDVSTTISQTQSSWEPAFRASEWFVRGWTLQELVAPASVEFFTKEGQKFGDKTSLEQQIHEVTGIALSALQGTPLSQFEVEERFKWAETRKTTREEDWAYCLLGIFGIFMPIIYGEGKGHAVRRLRKEITESSKHSELNHQEARVHTWMVPFERNSSFTGRKPELERLYQALSKADQTAKVAITGLGGVGKTQLALELIYRWKAEHKTCSIIWIPVTSKESLEVAYLNAARQLGIPGCDDKADVKRLVQEHLSRESAGQWLLVFDNADDMDMWIDKSAPDSGRLIDYLPKSGRGSILFTTRDKKAAVKFAGRNIIELSEMDEAGGEKLLRSHLVDQDLLENSGDVTALLTQLTCLPLAIVQAAVYINENGISAREYLSLLEEKEEDVIDLLSEDFEDERRYHDIKNPVATTWLISFEQVRQRDPLAADYLSFMACVDAKDIPRSLLPSELGKYKEAEQMNRRALNGREKALDKDHPDTLISINNLASALQYQGRYEEAEQMNRRALDGREKVLGKDHPDTLLSVDNLALVLNNLGKYEEAEKMNRRALDGQEKVHGKNHPDTLTSVSNLALVLGNLGKYEEAEKINRRALGGYEKALGKDHPSTLTSIHNLAGVLRGQGRYEEAEQMFRRAVSGSEKVLGKDHPDTLMSIYWVAYLCQEQSRFEEAERYYQIALNGYREVLGPAHPTTLGCERNYAVLRRFID
ncbi:hypothetical protein E8E14_013529 [Neopestalotiopsis sp. 37M]|nr:hypothetical protein E8E14_013529 [Neopestalotiopsis sp. 37M]